MLCSLPKRYELSNFISGIFSESKPLITWFSFTILGMKPASRLDVVHHDTDLDHQVRTQIRRHPESPDKGHSVRAVDLDENALFAAGVDAGAVVGVRVEVGEVERGADDDVAAVGGGEGEVDCGRGFESEVKEDRAECFHRV